MAIRNQDSPYWRSKTNLILQKVELKNYRGVYVFYYQKPKLEVPLNVIAYLNICRLLQ